MVFEPSTNVYVSILVVALIKPPIDMDPSNITIASIEPLAYVDALNATMTVIGSEVEKVFQKKEENVGVKGNNSGKKET